MHMVSFGTELSNKYFRSQYLPSRVPYLHIFPERANHMAHPLKQIDFARSLPKFMFHDNEIGNHADGALCPVIVVTMSDYIVKEINNMVMAKYAGGTAKRQGYPPELQIESYLIEAYIVNADGSHSRVKVDPHWGLENSAFDDAIRQIDDNANALAAGVELMGH